VDGVDHYLGPYGSDESHQLYERVIAEWRAKRQAQVARTSKNVSPNRQIGDLTVEKVIALFWRFAKSHYIKDGEPTGELDNLKHALRPVRKLYGSLPARDFGPLCLKVLQRQMIADGLSRPVINSRIGKIKRVFRWAVSEQLCPPDVLQGLQSVMGLQRGRTEAREPDPIEAVDDATIAATLPYLPPVVRDMVQFQRLVGCRPGEVSSVRPCDIDRSEAVWVYRPDHHKMQHLGRQRLIFVGPRAQEILKPYLLRDAESFCFSPAESQRRRTCEMRENRKSKVPPSQHDRSKARPQVKPGERYLKDAYARAIQRACDRAFLPPAELNEDDRAKWRKQHRWSPNQLRHATATIIRRRFGLEGAQVILGHSRADVTQVYAARDNSLAARIMSEVG
jgi:integrase